jgi:hypothetical protein
MVRGICDVADSVTETLLGADGVKYYFHCLALVGIFPEKVLSTDFFLRKTPRK